MWIALFCAFSFSLAVSFLLLRVGRKIGALDIPDGRRKRHGEATPRIGGLGIACGIAVGAGLFGFFRDREALTLLLPFFLFLAVGLADDFLNLSPLPKGLLESVGLLLWLSLSLGTFSGLAVAWFLLALFLINAYNFMDGADGIAVAYTAPAFLGLSLFFLLSGNVQALILSLLAAAGLLGFLPWNLPRAGLFMGDCGSLSVGFLFTALTLLAARDNAWALLFFLLPAFDALRVVILRLKDGQKPWLGDRRHLHHLLRERGCSAAGLFFLYLSFSLFLSVCTVAARFVSQ